MVAGRAKSEVGQKGMMTKADEKLQGVFDRSKQTRDGEVTPATTLLEGDDDASNDGNGDKDEGESGDGNEKNELDEDKFAKILAKAKKSKIFRGGKPVLNGLAIVGARKIAEEGVLQSRLDEILSTKERSDMKAAAREVSSKGDEKVVEKLEKKLQQQRVGKKPELSAFKKEEADALRRAKNLI